MFAAFVTHHLMTVGYIAIVKNVIDFADKKVNEKKKES